MRVLCLAFLLAEYPQLLRKFDAEAQGLARWHHCQAFLLGPRTLPPEATYGFTYIQLPWGMPLYYAVADRIIEETQPDIVYFRYIAADEHLYAFAARHGNIVFEHNTIEEAEYAQEQLARERRFGPRVLSHAAGACCVTAEILAHQRRRARRHLPGMVLGNGIHPAEVAPLHFDLPSDGVHMLCAAHFAPWHGVDRVIRGMAAYTGPTRFVLHLAGLGPEVETLLALAEQLGVEDRVHAHGFCHREALDHLAQRCHVGVGALGIHRKALQEAAAIKLREYCLQGLPFFFSGTDPDFDPLPSFARSVPNDESPVDMGTVEALARAVEKAPELRQDMRRHAEQALSWQRKAQAMAAFLEHCAQACAPARQARQARARGARQGGRSSGPVIPWQLTDYAALWTTQYPQDIFLLDVLDAHQALTGLAEDTYQWVVQEAARCTTQTPHADPVASPCASVVQLWLGLALEGRGKVGEALAAHTRALRLDQHNDWQAPLRLTLIHRALGHRPKADSYQALCLERCPTLAVIFQAQ